MSPLGQDTQSQDARPEGAHAWDSVLRIREPVAWLLLTATAVAVVVSASQLFGGPGAPAPLVPVGPIPSPVSGGPVSSGLVTSAPVPAGAAPGTPHQVAVASFAVRAAGVAPHFVASGLFVLPVLAVILVAFAFGVTDRARRVVQGAVAAEALAIALGVTSWFGAIGAHQERGAWFIFDLTDLAAVVARFIFVVAVLRSPALQPLARRLP